MVKKAIGRHGSVVRLECNAQLLKQELSRYA